jgi:hypothetical protein
MGLNRSLDENVYDLNAILHPGSVLADATVSRAKKRAILASWASDAAAVTSCPSLWATKGGRADRRHPGSAFQSGLLTANATWRQAGKAEVDRPDRSGCLGAQVEKKRRGDDGDVC